ncbi:hypothetical protein ACEWY4_025114 [Coilia grayii]|uniref:Complement factor I n=1 Tax=Coilia grayii TaxID=363190 RepID=A0ABD1IWM4_9TELE
MKTKMKFPMGTILLVLLLVQNTHLLSSDGSRGRGKKPAPAPAAPAPAAPAPAAPAPAPIATQTPPASAYLGAKECLDKKYTHLSCNKAYCPVGRRCVPGKAECECEMPYKCTPVENQTVCGDDGKSYRNMCNLMALTCKLTTARFSHTGANCSADNIFSTSLKTVKDVIEVKLPNSGTRALVCQNDRMNIVTAHVVCRHKKNKLAKKASTMQYEEALKMDASLPDVCVDVSCKGHEYSLAECKIGPLTKLKPKSHIVQAQCYKDDPNPNQGEECQFQCANGRCVKLSNTCNGVNNCGDGSDEMCCKECRAGAFHCRSDVCIPDFALNDGVPDCLNKDDEVSSEGEKPKPETQPKPNATPGSPSKPKPTAPSPNRPPKPTNSRATTPLPPTTEAVPTDEYLGPRECLSQKYTQRSCTKAFCPPWMRCLDGVCVCKLPYMCLRQGQSACDYSGRKFFNYCQTLAVSCRSNQKVFSHFAEQCSATNVFSTSLKTDKKVVEVRLPNISRSALVCAQGWNMAAANVVCRDVTNRVRKAASAGAVEFSEVQGPGVPGVCVRVQCTGHEYSLAECNMYGDMRTLTARDQVASVNCATDDTPGSKCEFRCSNGQCVQLTDTCDGVNHCEDGSDEMCCKACRGSAFHCQSNVCIPGHAVGDGIRDCLGGDDEIKETVAQKEKEKLFLTRSDQPTVQEEAISVPKQEIQLQRDLLETLECGVPNMNYKPSDSTRRRKRVVGGQETEPTQIQWQVAIQDEGKVNCGGAYLGGCWVLTAAHCVRDKPDLFRVKFSLWEKRSKIDTTDIAFVKKVHIHHSYDAASYENDIALLELRQLGGSTKCLRDNPAIRAVCVPWSKQQFQPGHNCTISGWGRDREGRSQNRLQWASVSLIDDCQSYYKARYRPGMMCAGDLLGSVDSCQGDSGGPLVCKDVGGVSYVWGVVSWGERCGQQGYPGVYTQVAHYYEWIRTVTNKHISKYNQ